MSLLMQVALSLSMITTDAPSSSTLLAQSLELIQKNEKAKALKLLEKAFENTQEPDELKEISVLILEASSANYPKRDAYLRYLIKVSPEHTEAYKWLKELGDRALDKGQLEEAEDWYLRALSSTDEKALINYKLAFVKWNLKQLLDALRLFIEILDMGEPGLQAQVKKDIAKIWWEIGALPHSYIGKINSLPDDAFHEVLANFFESAPKGSGFGDKEEALFLQLTDSEKANALVSEFLQNESLFKKQPCFPFKKIITSEDSFSRNLFLACLKSSDRPPAATLIMFFSHFPEPNERILWAHSELLTELEHADAALALVFRAGSFLSASKDFLDYIESLLLKRNEEAFRSFYAQFDPNVFEEYLSAHKSDAVLVRLQAIDADRWIPFEEKKYDGKEPKEFLLKKGVWLSKKPTTTTEDLQKIFDKLLKAPNTPEAKSLSSAYKNLQKRADSKLPETFSKAFNTAFNKWVNDLDKYLISLHASPAEWQIVAQPIFQIEVQRNLEAIVAQLDASTLDPSLSELAETFTQKKEELKADLKAKYAAPPEETKK